MLTSFSFVKNYLMFGEEVQFFFPVVYGITELYSSVIPCIIIEYFKICASESYMIAFYSNYFYYMCITTRMFGY